MPSATKAGYHEALTRFEARHGEIVSAVWCSHVESAVALTAQEAHAALGDPGVEFHRESDWATQNSPDIARELHRCDELAVRAKTVLTGRPAAHLHAARDGLGSTSAEPRRRAGRPRRRPTKAEEALQQERAALVETEKYYREAANGQAQIVYFLGMAAVAIPISSAPRSGSRSTGPPRSRRSSPALSAESSASSSASTPASSSSTTTAAGRTRSSSAASGR